MAIVDADAALVGSSTFGATSTVAWAADSELINTSTLTATINVVTGYAAPVAHIPPARSVLPGKMILDQVDLFLGDGVTRAQDVVIANLELRVYVGSSQLDWTLLSGVGIPDVQVTAGKVYWTEFSAGFYNIRFFPNLVGLWRVVLTYPTHDQAVSYVYDVSPASAAPGVGIRASFVRR